MWHEHVPCQRLAHSPPCCICRSLILFPSSLSRLCYLVHLLSVSLNTLQVYSDYLQHFHSDSLALVAQCLPSQYRWTATNDCNQRQCHGRNISSRFGAFRGVPVGSAGSGPQTIHRFPQIPLFSRLSSIISLESPFSQPSVLIDPSVSPRAMASYKTKQPLEPSSSAAVGRANLKSARPVGFSRTRSKVISLY